MPKAQVALADKGDCAREPIHIPGSIQPHGYLLVLDPQDHRVIAVSQNTADALRLPPAEISGRPVTEFLASTKAQGLSEAIGATDRDVSLRVRFRHSDEQAWLDCFARQGDGVILLELETAAPDERAMSLFGQVRSGIERIRACESLAAAFDALAAEVRELSGFDRVMVYRFDPDWNGRVIAENKSPRVHSYLGHAFPASDIPAQARALYLRNTFRIIPDARYTPSLIVPALHPLWDTPFDLSNTALRSVSPVHLEYLANMGVAASMSISIVRGGQLWGLVACHHSEARVLPRAVLQGCDLLAQAAAWNVDAEARATSARCLAAVRRLESEIATSGERTCREKLESIAPSLLGLTSSDGLAISDDQGVWAVGRRPTDVQISALVHWLSASGEERVTTDRLSTLLPRAAAYAAVTSGVAAVKLPNGWLIWFRAEWPHTLDWAGEPGVTVRLGANDGRINPRKSFASWREKVRGRSTPWSAPDVSAIDEIQGLVLRAMVAEQVRLLTASEKALSAAKLHAEEASVAKSQFLAHMSHEIRTPLNGVLGMAQVMATGPLAAAQRERLDVIQKSSVGLLAILNDILDLSKIEAGRLELEETSFDISEVAESACATFASIADAKGLVFVLEVADRARGIWRGDPVRLRQVLTNLVSNAVKFTSQGEVRVAVDAPTQDGLMIAVADTGIGVAPEALPHLFDAFVQANSSTTRLFGGTGLGLTICQHIVALMGGVIEAHSEVGRGTTFEIRLPLTWEAPDMAAVEASPPEADDEGPDVSSLRILAADDNETNRQVIKAVLNSLGVAPVLVANGRLAIDAWSAGQFDLILMDVQMPVLDGIRATGEIRRIEAERCLPRTRIIAFSAGAMTHQVAEYLDAGFDGHLAKPIVVAELFAVLVEVAGSAAESGSSSQSA